MVDLRHEEFKIVVVGKESPRRILKKKNRKKKYKKNSDYRKESV